MSCGHPDHGNVGIVKPGDSPRIERGADVDAHRARPFWFVGRYVKIGIPTPRGSKEWLWVRVDGLDVARRELVGRIWNTPVFASCEWGDEIAFTTDEIVDVTDGAD